MATVAARQAVRRRTGLMPPAPDTITDIWFRSPLSLEEIEAKQEFRSRLARLEKDAGD